MELALESYRKTKTKKNGGPILKLKNVCLVFCQAMLKRQFQRKFENMQSGQSDKAEEYPDCSMSGKGSQGSGKYVLSNA